VIATEKPEVLSAFLGQARQDGKRVGLYPTMGAFHGGHRSNIRQMAAECDVAAVSIFVNPLRLAPGQGTRPHPPDPGADLAQARQAGADIVLASRSDAMFPAEPLVPTPGRPLADVSGPREHPGLIDGTTSLLTKLFATAGPCYGYFGEKDYGHLVLVRRLVSDKSLPVVVVSCPIVREPDGLALSGRNAHLSAAERQAAPVLYWSLLAGKRVLEEHPGASAAQVRAAMLAASGRQELFQLAYAEVVDPRTLVAVEPECGEVRLMIAGRIGSTRLIDNVAANTGED
jgi:pantoate--beta-alanine ligase